MRQKILILILLILAGYLAAQLLLKNLRGGSSVIMPADALPDNIRQEVVIKDSEVIITKRVPPAVPGGEEKIVRETKYLPPEGGAIVSVDLEGNTGVELKNKGFTFTPGAFFLAGRDCSAGLGARLVYWDRFGLGAGAAISLGESREIAPFAFADMRLKDIGLNNAAAGIFVKPNAVGISLAVYFK